MLYSGVFLPGSGVIRSVVLCRRVICFPNTIGVDRQLVRPAAVSVAIEKETVRSWGGHVYLSGRTSRVGTDRAADGCAREPLMPNTITLVSSVTDIHRCHVASVNTAASSSVSHL